MTPERNSNPDKMTFDVSIVEGLLYMVTPKYAATTSIAQAKIEVIRPRQVWRDNHELKLPIALL